MGLENTNLSDLVAVDETYEDRIQLRRRILAEHSSTTGTRPGCDAAVIEFYDWMMGVYLPQRYPTMYELGGKADSTFLRNLVTDETIPLHVGSTREALRIIGSHVDTDFLFLLPSGEDQKYHLEAFVTCFPSGFSTLDKLGLPLAAIHTPVPGYAAKLEKSMDRFFGNLPAGRIVKRANWSVTTNDLLFAESGNHLYGKNEKTLDATSATVEDDIARQKKEVQVDQCRLRCERQTLHRLPKSNALVFAFKTYQYKLAEVKAEGSGEDLANAISGLGSGSVPQMMYYKRGVVWGDAVREYLLS
ncbi:hypothetical protein MBLNU459_g0600t1 [Dothideomycetes sp. NU459]